MSEAATIERTNAATETSCAWPGCGDGRQGWARIDRGNKGAEYLPACGRHKLAAANDPDLALRVWSERQTRGNPPRSHVNEVLVGSLLKEITRVPGISRDRLLAWHRMQQPQRGLGPVETRAGQPTMDDHDTDALAAIAALVRDHGVRERKSMGAIAYWPPIDSDDTSEEIACPAPNQPSASPSAATGTTTPTATTTATPPATSAASSRAAATTTAPTTTAASVGARGRAGSATARRPSRSPSTAPASPSEAAAMPGDDCNDSATGSSRNADTGVDYDSARNATTPGPADVAFQAPTATTSPSDARTEPPSPVPAEQLGARADDGSVRAPDDDTDTDTDTEPAMPTTATTPLTDRVLAHLRVHSGQLAAEIAAALGEDTAPVSTALRGLRRQGLARGVDDRTARPSGRAPVRWWIDGPATATAPADADTDADKTAPGTTATPEQERITFLEGELADWQRAANERGDELLAIDFVLALWGAPVPSTRAEKLAAIRRRHEADARDLAAIRIEKARWIKDESELREWRRKVESALGFDEDKHAPIADVLRRIEGKIYRAHVAGKELVDEPACDHIAPMPGDRCALCNHREPGPEPRDDYQRGRADGALDAIARMVAASRTNPTTGVQVDTYKVLGEAVERGAIAGVRRAHKHIDNPSEVQLIEHVEREVMNAIAEVVVFPEVSRG